MTNHTLAIALILPFAAFYILGYAIGHRAGRSAILKQLQ